MSLTNKQRAFVEHYLKTWNATEAARLAGYSEKSIRSIASENLTKPDIQAAIQERLDKAAMQANEVLYRLTLMGRGFDFTKYVSFRDRYEIDKDGNAVLTGTTLKIDLDGMQADGYSHLIKRLKQTTAGSLDIEWHDQMRALELIGRHHALFTDKVDLSTGGRPLDEAMEKALDKVYGTGEDK